MSTNYYWYIPKPATIRLPTGETYEYEIDDMNPKIHIGKRSGKSFTWAQKPEQVIKVCDHYPYSRYIVDEYGDRLTCKEFIKLVNACDASSTDSVGKMFS